MLSRRIDKKKKQSRLSFTPVPSSSPQRPEAHVRLNDATTPRKKRRIVSGSVSDSDVEKLSPDVAQAIALSKQDNLKVVLQSPRGKRDQLPTPELSSQIEQSGEEGMYLISWPVRYHYAH